MLWLQISTLFEEKLLLIVGNKQSAAVQPLYVYRTYAIANRYEAYCWADLIYYYYRSYYYESDSITRYTYSFHLCLMLDCAI